MRKLALVAVIGVGMTLGASAFARPWNDPNGRLTFDAPSGWVMEVRASAPATIVIAGNANNECYVISMPNSATANGRISSVRNPQQPSADAWAAAANGVRSMFPNQNAQATPQPTDTSGPWPVLRANIAGAERPVMAGIQSRPGFDLMAFCWSYGGPDATAIYEQFFRSLAHPNDEAWLLQASTEVDVAPAAAPAAEEAPAQPQRRQRRQRGVTAQPGTTPASPM